MLGATRTPLFSILNSQTVNNTRIKNKADMGLVWVFLHIRVNVGKCRIFKNTGKKQFSSFSESLKKGKEVVDRQSQRTC